MAKNMIFLWFLMIEGSVVRWLNRPINEETYLEIRGYGIYEPMPKKVIDRPLGTGDWLLMHFHTGAHTEINGVKTTIEKPFTILWEPKNKQLYSGLHSEALHSWVHFQGTYIREMQMKMNIEKNQEIALSGETLVLMLKLLHEECNQLSSETILKSLFTFLFQKISKEQNQLLKTNKIPEGLLNVQNYIEQNFTNAIFLQNLANIAKVSVPHFCFLYKKHFGCSPVHYVTKLKIEKAKYLLGNINYNVGEIASTLGYKDIYQFSRLFKIYTGLSPLNFRKVASDQGQVVSGKL